MTRRIVSVRFIPDALHYKALALLDDETTYHLFAFYPEEYTFTEEELIGLTTNQAQILAAKREEEYLQT